MWQFWLIAAGVFFIFEIFTLGFLVFWFGIGALLAMVVSFFTSNVIIQSSVFVISSGILIFATKPFVKKFAKSNDTAPTNVYSVIGKIGKVTEDIDNIQGTGIIKVAGEEWSAICNGNITISKGTEVKVLEVRGVKALVEPINSSVSQK